MGCLNSTSNTKVQPFDHSKENGTVPTSHQNGHTPSSKKVPDTPRETLGQIPDQKDIYNNNAGKDTRIATPTTQTAATPTTQIEEEQETTVVQTIELTQNKDSELETKSSKPGTLQQSTEKTPGNQSARSAEKVVEYQSTRSTDKNSSNQSERSVEKTSGDQSDRSADKTPGDQSQRSTNREPIVVPTMSVPEEDELKKQYTIKEISIHNHEKGYIDIFPLRKDIYSTTKFKKAMEIVVRQKYDKFQEENKKVDRYDYEDFKEKWKFSPIFLVLFRYKKMYLRFSDIKKELPGCKVASVPDEQNELYEDIINDSKNILEDLKGQKGKIGMYVKEYQELLERFLRLCDEITNSPISISSFKGRSCVMNAQDPNSVEFLLPETVEASDLRKWIETWKQFDTELPKEGVWKELPDNVVNAISDPLNLEDICRVSSDGLPDLDFTIDGEAAWPVIELDIVKNDITTKEQDKIWRIRENRTDMNDPQFLLSRQTRLEMYFINKYEWDSSKLEPFRGFTARLQRAWKEFEALCVDEFSVIPEDEY